MRQITHGRQHFRSIPLLYLFYFKYYLLFNHFFFLSKIAVSLLLLI